MSPAVTDIGFALLREGHTHEDLARSAAILLARPGCTGVRSARLLDAAGEPVSAGPDGKCHAAVTIADWDSLEQLRAWQADKPDHDVLIQDLTLHLAEPPQNFVAQLGPAAPGVLRAPAVEALRVYFPGGDAFTPEVRERAEKTVRSFLDKVAGKEDVEFDGSDGSGKETGRYPAKGLVGEPALGWSVEEFPRDGELCRVLFVAIGWEAVQNHVDYRQTPEFNAIIGMLRGLEHKKGMEMHHFHPKEW